MGARIEMTDTGTETEVHLFDTKAAAERYVTASRGYTYDRHEPWGFTAGLDFYQGPRPKDRAAIREAPGGYWKAVFWPVTER